MNNKDTVQTFMSSIPPESKVAVIIPLYGFWKDVEIEQLDKAVLDVALSRVQSSKHKFYLLFMGEPERLTPEIQNALLARKQAGNAEAIPLAPFAPYASYITEGINYALEKTDAEYIVVYNPWAMLKENSIDQLVERLNRGDVGIVSGYEANADIEAGAFDQFNYNLPKDYRDIGINLFGMKRQLAQMLNLDGELQTHFFIAQDFWRTLQTKGFEGITTQYVPVWGFDIDWTILESLEDYHADLEKFRNKWHFDPNIQYPR